MPEVSSCDVLVIGGGHAGLMLGAGLAQAGFAVRLVERQPIAAIEEAEPSGRSLALLAGSVRIARKLGVWAAIVGDTAAIERVEVRDVTGGARVRYEREAPSQEPFGVGVEHTTLRRGLLRAFLAAAGEPAWLTGEISDLRRGAGAVEAVLADGRRIRAALLVGADGRASRVRELARIGVDSWDYGQHAITLVLRSPHRGAVHEWLRRSGPLATLPLPGQRTGITWVERSEEARRLVALDRTALAASLVEATGGALAGATIESGPSAYPLGALHARRYVAPRLALVGDAAHGVHPIHAQGFNMGVADIGALAESLTSTRARGLDPGSGEALLPYARLRRSENTQRLWLTDGLVRLFTNDLAPLRAARSLALNAIDNLAPLKRLAVRHGMQAG